MHSGSQIELDEISHQNEIIEFKDSEEQNQNNDTILIKQDEKCDENKNEKLLDQKYSTFQIQNIAQQIKKFKGILNKYSRQVCAFITLAILSIIFINYQQFKKHCTFDSNERCLREFILPNLKKWVLLSIINSLLSIFLIHLLIKKATYPIISLLILIQIIFLYVLTDQTITDQYYIGVVNAAHLAFIGLFFTLYLTVLGCIASYRKSKKCFVALQISISFLIALVYYFSVLHSCDYWPLGINGRIETVEGTCNIQTPKYCWYKVTDGLLDASKIFHDCKQLPKNKRTFNKFFSEALKGGAYIGFKNLNQLPERDRMDSNLQKTVSTNARGFDSVKAAQQAGNEVVFDSEKQIYYIDVIRNSTLAEERKKIYKTKKNKSLAKNVLLIFTDSISRQSMHLKLRKTLDWFEERAKKFSYKANQVNHEAESESYEFYRYNSFFHFTQPNYLALMYENMQISEYYKLNNTKEKYVNILDGIKANGYITGHSASFCNTMSYRFEEEQYQYLNSSRFDHETQSFACDPNFYMPGEQWNIYTGPYSTSKRCLYGKMTSEYTLEYAKSFFTKYRDSSKFYIAEFSEAHEFSGDGARKLDKPYSKFLKTMTQEGLLDDTVVILFSDHGLHMSALFYVLELDNVQKERNLPGLLINLPPRMNQKYGERIGLNQQKFVTAYNLHHFVQHVIIGDTYEQKDKGLLIELQNQQFCADVAIQEENCSCK